MKTLVKVIFLIAALLLIYSVLYIYSLSRVKVKDIRVDKVDLNLSGIVIAGRVLTYNGGIVPVSVDKIAYSALFKSGEKLADGKVKGGFIGPGKTSDLNFSLKSDWMPSGKLVLSLITPGSTNVTLSGTADLILAKVPFTKNIDIEQYLKDYVRQRI